MPMTHEPASFPKPQRNPLPNQILMGQHDFRLIKPRSLGLTTTVHPETGMYCVLCHAKMNSERGQAPCTGRPE